MSEYKIIKSYGNISAYTDWSPALDAIKNTEEKVILELGLGAGTQTLINRFKQVISFEVARTNEWYEKSLKDYGQFSQWSSKFILMSELGLEIDDNEILKSGGSVRNQESMQRYFQALEAFVPTLNTIDVAFVDQGFHFRGETVNYFLEKGIPEIIAHDTSNHNHIYGYDTVKIPSNYASQTFGGLGTTIFSKIK